MGMLDFHLQPACRGDAPRLAAMAQQCVEHGLRPRWSTARILWHVRDVDSVVLTARRADALAGFAVMRYADTAAHLNLLAVVPVHRRRGVARALLGWLEETARTAGAFDIGLELRAGNAAARACYLALGYRELDCIPGYYQGVEAAIRMTRDVRAGATPAAGAPPQPPADGYSSASRRKSNS